MRRLICSVAFLLLAGGAVLAGVNGGVPTTVNGLISFLGLTSGTSGGIPYFSSSSTLASSAVMSSTNVIIGGGAGAAPTASGCQIDSGNSINCSSASSYNPAFNVINTTADANYPNLRFIHGRNSSVGLLQNGDAMGALVFAGGDGAGQVNAAGVVAYVDGTPGAGDMPSRLVFSTTNDGSSSQSERMRIDAKGHLGYTGTAPSITSCGTSPSVATGTDNAGQVTEGATATGCTITFAMAYAATPFCTVGSQTQVLAFAYTLSTTAITVTNTSTSGDKINWVCFGT